MLLHYTNERVCFFFFFFFSLHAVVKALRYKPEGRGFETL
jgi:hypothetical protein